MTADAAHLDPPLVTHRAGEAALLAEYPDTAAVLAAAAAVERLAPAHLVELVPAERTLLLVATAARDLPALAALLDELPVPAALETTAAEVQLGIIYDGEDLHEVAELLGISSQALVAAHAATLWTAAFGGFAPGFAYLVPDPAGRSGAGIPWEVPRRAEPRTTVPAGSVGLASRYCGVYPRASPGGWQLIGRSDAAVFDEHRQPPALLAPGTRVRFVAQRATARASTTALVRAVREGAGPGRRTRRRAADATSTSTSTSTSTAPSTLSAGTAGATGSADTAGATGSTSSASSAASSSSTGSASTAPAHRSRTHTVLEVVSSGPLTLPQDAGRPGLAAIGVSTSGAFDQGARIRANLAVGNPGRAPVLETLIGPLVLRAQAPTVVAVSGASAPWEVRRADDPRHAPIASTTADGEQPIALDPGDLLTVGPATEGLRLVLAVRGGIRADGGEVLGSISRDTLSGLGPAPLTAGDRVQIGEEHALEAVPAVVPRDEPTRADGPEQTLEIPVHPGPRDGILGPSALSQLFSTAWTVRPDSDRVGIRLDGPGLPVPAGIGALPSEPMVPGAIQVPPSGLPVVFGPDHPTTGGYPVIAVVTRAGLDRLAQAAPGATVQFRAVR